MGVWRTCPSGVRGRAPGQRSKERSSPEAETLLVYGRSMDTVNLLSFVKFGHLKIRFFWFFCKFSRSKFVTVYCELMQNAEIT